MNFEIINLIIGILSLIATIAISFVIYFLERRNEKRREEFEIKETAKKFIREKCRRTRVVALVLHCCGLFSTK